MGTYEDIQWHSWPCILTHDLRVKCFLWNALIQFICKLLAFHRKWAQVAHAGYDDISSFEMSEVAPLVITFFLSKVPPYATSNSELGWIFVLTTELKSNSCQNFLRFSRLNFHTHSYLPCVDFFHLIFWNSAQIEVCTWLLGSLWART